MAGLVVMAEHLVLRPIRPEDIPAVLALQAQAYASAYHEEASAFLSRLSHGVGLPTLALTSSGELAAYLFAHPWWGETIPPLGQPLLPAGEADQLFLHDLSVAPAWRGLGAGACLLSAVLANGVALGFSRLRLVAVAGAENYWSRLGLEPVGPAGEGYGVGARLMAGDVPDIRRILLEKSGGYPL